MTLVYIQIICCEQDVYKMLMFPEGNKQGNKPHLLWRETTLVPCSVTLLVCNNLGTKLFEEHVTYSSFDSKVRLPVSMITIPNPICVRV